MKKFLLILVLMLGLTVFADEAAVEIETEKKPPPPLTAEQYEEYWSKYYAGMTYSEGLLADRPLMLIFAEPGEVFKMFRLTPLGPLLFFEFNGKYNCAIINIEYGIKGRFDKYFQKKHNPDYLFHRKLAEDFNVTIFPTVFLIDPKERTYIEIDPEECDEETLREYMTDYLMRTTLTPEEYEEYVQSKPPREEKI